MACPRLKKSSIIEPRVSASRLRVHQSHRDGLSADRVGQKIANSETTICSSSSIGPDSHVVDSGSILVEHDVQVCSHVGGDVRDLPSRWRQVREFRAPRSRFIGLSGMPWSHKNALSGCMGTKTPEANGTDSGGKMPLTGGHAPFRI